MPSGFPETKNYSAPLLLEFQGIGILPGKKKGGKGGMHLLGNWALLENYFSIWRVPLGCGSRIGTQNRTTGQWKHGLHLWSPGWLDGLGKDRHPFFWLSLTGEALPKKIDKREPRATKASPKDSTSGRPGWLSVSGHV